jgi:hypothetical protein
MGMMKKYRNFITNKEPIKEKPALAGFSFMKYTLL